jgi:NADH-quinone oxidoreductase subunit N
MLIALSVAPYLSSSPTSESGVGAMLYYLVAYGAMTIGAFAVIAFLSRPERPVETVDDLAGLGSSHPGVALLMVLFLFSLIGIPMTAGFTGKLQVFFAALSVQSADHATLFRVLAFLGAVNAAIGGWYYLRIVAAMYLRTPLQPLAPNRAAPGLATLLICAALTLGLSVNPGADWLMRAARAAAFPTNPVTPPAAAQR